MRRELARVRSSVLFTERDRSVCSKNATKKKHFEMGRDPEKGTGGEEGGCQRNPGGTLLSRGGDKLKDLLKKKNQEMGGE